MSSWKQVGTVMPTELTGARLEAHHAVQWPARLTRAYCPPEADDSHTSLTWDVSEEALFTRPISENFTFGLRIRDLSLLVRSVHGQQVFSLKGHGDKDVGEWISRVVSRQGLDPLKLKAPAPYTLPDHPIDSGEVYGKVSDAAFEELAKYYNNAAHLFEEVRASRKGASLVRCWPHHFDIATLIMLDQSGGEEARSIGVGSSPGDETYPEPYFYISPWPYPSVSSLPTVMTPAFWHREGFTAIILRSSDLISTSHGEKQYAQARSTINEGIVLNLEILKR